jgi:hypothetical protein
LKTGDFCFWGAARLIELCRSDRENLKNMGVIEPAYLSGRTAALEEASGIVQMTQTEPRNIRPSHTKQRYHRQTGGFEAGFVC